MRDNQAGQHLAYLALGNLPQSVPLHWYRTMEAALARLGLTARISPRNTLLANVARVITRVKLNRPLCRLGRRAYIVPIMQPSEARFFPVSYFAEVIPYCFDIWPPRWDEWEEMFRRHRVRIAFFTARQSADEFRRRIPAMEIIWVPEATDPAWLKPDKPMAARSIDVLELGRKYDAYHDLIAPRLAALGKTHPFEKIKGEMLYTRFEDTAAGYGDSKISLCFPSSLTHPARSGDIETVTMRYYESMGSRCLVVGKCPQELKDDFGYNPIVEADKNNAADQIEDILAHIDRYQELVEKNYQTVLKQGTWDVRFRRIVDELEKRGYQRGSASHA